jgi:CubicO group peptidase (beta-lactamase class C family)
MAAMMASATGAPVIRADGFRELGKSETVRVNDRWHVGSVAKSMSSTLVGRLVDQS